MAYTGRAAGRAQSVQRLSDPVEISLTGDANGSIELDGSQDVSISVSVADDSHNHIIGNVDGLQTALDLKANQSTTYTKTEVDTAITNATPSFDTLTGKPTTVSGYGITDAYTKTETDSAIAGVVNSAPETLDTLNELSAALGDDPNFATTVTNLIGAKQDASTALTTSSSFGGDVSGTYDNIVVDSSILKRDTADTLTAPFRGTITNDNDGSFDMNATNNFFCIPTDNITLTFTNITSGQSGNIIFINGNNYTISANSTTYISAYDLSLLSTSGTYWVSYMSDVTNVYVSISQSLTSAGA